MRASSEVPSIASAVSTITVRAPTHKGRNSSSAAMSNETVVIAGTTSRAASPGRRAIAVSRLTTER